jgi:uncharacterized protein YbjT (DUF2867 family)
MTVLVTGATGFTGRRVVRELCRAGRPVRCFVRPGSDRSVLDDLPVEFRCGDLGEPDGLRRALEGAEVLVNTASLGFGHATGIVEACRREGVRRAVFFSTTAIFTSLPAPSRRVRLEAEETVRRSGLAFTILRPTMIYGAPGDRNVERLLRAVARLPVLPVVGGAGRRIQPVLVDDLAKAVISVLDAPVTTGRAYALPGRAPVGFGEFVRLAGRAVGRRVRLLAVPPPLAVAGARLCEALWTRPRIKAEQVLRLLEDKDFSWARAGRDFGFDPTPVAAGLGIEAERLGLGGEA